MTPPLMIAALLHPALPLGWTHFTVHWSTVVGCAALGGVYVWAERGARRAARDTSGAGVPPQHQYATASSDEPHRSSAHRSNFTPRATRDAHPPKRLLFFAGLFVILVSLNGPLHDLSDTYLFSAHMVQHLVLTLIVPPLLIAGTPGWMLRTLLRDARVMRIARAVTRPTTCFAIFNVVIAVWHLPPMYNFAMAHHPVHIVQHLMFMAAAVLMWWPFLSPLPELPRLAYPGQMLYCFLMGIPMSIVAIYVTMADQVLYPAYASAPRLWGLTPMEDQQLGGLIMWIPGGLFFYGVMTVVFFKWAAKQDDSTAGAQVA